MDVDRKPTVGSIARRWIRRRLDAFPPLYMFVFDRLWRPGQVSSVTPGVRLVIEGYPRSGNTFSRHAIRVSQGGDDGIGTHFHASANVVTAVRRGIPTVVLVRRPADAVASAVIKLAEVPLGDSLRDWVAYHERILPHRSAFLVVRFEEATRDFPRMLRRINERFGLDLVVPDSHEAVRAAAFESIAAKRRLVYGDDLPEGFITNTPDATRDARKREAVAAYASERYAGLRARAEELYAILVGGDAARD